MATPLDIALRPVDWRPPLVAAREQAMLAAGLFDGMAASMRLSTWQVIDDDNPPAGPYTLTDLGVAAVARQAAFDGVSTWLAGQLAGSHPAGQDWLYLHGPYGAGKTHLAIGLLYELMAATGQSGSIVNWSSTMEQLMEGIGNGTSSHAEARLTAARSAAYLVLDDLDKADGSKFTLRKLYTLVDGRLMSGLVTIITANRPLADLTTYWVSTARQEERTHIADRAMALAERLCWATAGEVEFAGPSFRLR